MKRKIQKSLEGLPDPLQESLYKILNQLNVTRLTLYKRYCQMMGMFYRLQPLNPKKMVVVNFYGQGYGGNPKAIVEALMPLDSSLDIVWLYDPKRTNKDSFPSSVRLVPYATRKAMYELATAKVWLDNARKFFMPKKRQAQYYMQTWHAGITLKKVEKDAVHSLEKNYIKHAIKDAKQTDIMISNSIFTDRLYHESFWYEGELLTYGTPRCDSLVYPNEDSNKKVREYFNLAKDTNIVLYAPTFRANGQIDQYQLDYDALLDVLKIRDTQPWVVLLRLHPNVISEASNIIYNENLRNASSYPDMYELLSMSDVLLTDYSGVMFEFAVTKKPVFLYCLDLEIYRKERDFYFELDQLPFTLATSQESLFQNIQAHDDMKYLTGVDKFFSLVELHETGHASQKAAEWLIEKL